MATRLNKHQNSSPQNTLCMLTFMERTWKKKNHKEEYCSTSFILKNAIPVRRESDPAWCCRPIRCKSSWSATSWRPPCNQNRTRFTWEDPSLTKIAMLLQNVRANAGYNKSIQILAVHTQNSCRYSSRPQKHSCHISVLRVPAAHTRDNCECTGCDSADKLLPTLWVSTS